MYIEQRSALPTPPELAPITVSDFIRAHAFVLDVRRFRDYSAAHLPGSIMIGLNGQFAGWVKTIVCSDLEPRGGPRRTRLFQL
jgi:hypothetical protein